MELSCSSNYLADAKVIKFSFLSPVQIQVLSARFPKRTAVLTVAWAIKSIAYLGGYLEHRRKSPIGIQVLWRGWSNLHDLCQGWLLAKNHT
jgi:hypothetical protein